LGPYLKTRDKQQKKSKNPLRLTERTGRTKNEDRSCHAEFTGTRTFEGMEGLKGGEMEKLGQGPLLLRSGSRSSPYMAGGADARI